MLNADALPVALVVLFLSSMVGCVTDNVASVPITVSVVGVYPVTAVFESVLSNATLPPDADAIKYLVVGVTAVTTALPCPEDVIEPVATVIFPEPAVATVFSDSVHCVVV